MIKIAYQKNAEDKLFSQWNLEHLFMNEDNFISFEDYKNKAFNINSNTKQCEHTKTKSEIKTEVNQFQENHKNAINAIRERYKVSKKGGK